MPDAILKIKNSSTLASVPSGLTAGEMAINIADKKLYIGGTGGRNIIFYDATSSVGSFNGLTGAVQGVSSVNGITGAVSLPASAFTQVLLSTEGGGIQSSDANIYAGGTADTLTIKAGPGILLTGNSASDSFTITNLAANAFLTIGFGPTGAGVIEGVPFLQADLAQDTLTIQSGTGTKIVVDHLSDTYSIFNTGVLSFNGATGAVTGITAGGANTFTQLNTFSAGISASGATFTGNISARNIVNSFNGVTGAVTGITAGGANTFTALNTFSAGISASGATFSAPISSTRMARHTSAAISAQKTADFTPTAAEDGTVFYINYSGKGSVTVTFDSLPIGWRAKFLNVGSGAVYYESTGDIYGEGSLNPAAPWLMEAICIDTNTYFIG